MNDNVITSLLHLEAEFIIGLRNIKLKARIFDRNNLNITILIS